jgi:dihydroneopterin aldolase
VNGELRFERYRTCAILGVDPYERRQPREIFVTVILRWTTCPRACENDNLEETLCYATLARAIDGALQGHTFLLLERLTGFLYDQIRSFVTSTEKTWGGDVRLSVKVTKPYPPVRGLPEASFTCSDW